MIKEKTKTDLALDCIGKVSPECKREIYEVMRSFSCEPEEIRLRADGANSVRLFGKDYYLTSKIGSERIEELFLILTDGALYTERDKIRDGYITLGGGIRVGVGGRASYNGGVCVGVGEISTLVFRIPHGACSFGEELYHLWQSLGESGMLIISPPGGGKTTVLRSLAGYIGRHRRTVIADERCEFDPEDYKGRHVDILRGYKRATGIEIAVRTMSAEVIMCDEIFTDADTEAALGAQGAGVTVIATAHGTDISGVTKRRAVRTLIDAGMFSSLVTVVRTAGKFGYTYEEIS